MYRYVISIIPNEATASIDHIDASGPACTSIAIPLNLINGLIEKQNFKITYRIPKLKENFEVVWGISGRHIIIRSINKVPLNTHLGEHSIVINFDGVHSVSIPLVVLPKGMDPSSFMLMRRSYLNGAIKIQKEIYRLGGLNLSSGPTGSTVYPRCCRRISLLLSEICESLNKLYYVGAVITTKPWGLRHPIKLKKALRGSKGITRPRGLPEDTGVELSGAIDSLAEIAVHSVGVRDGVQKLKTIVLGLPKNIESSKKTAYFGINDRLRKIKNLAEAAFLSNSMGSIKVSLQENVDELFEYYCFHSIMERLKDLGYSIDMKFCKAGMHARKLSNSDGFLFDEPFAPREYQEKSCLFPRMQCRPAFFVGHKDGHLIRVDWCPKVPRKEKKGQVTPEIIIQSSKGSGIWSVQLLECKNKNAPLSDDVSLKFREKLAEDMTVLAADIRAFADEKKEGPNKGSKSIADSISGTFLVPGLYVDDRPDVLSGECGLFVKLENIAVPSHIHSMSMHPRWAVETIDEILKIVPNVA